MYCAGVVLTVQLTIMVTVSGFYYPNSPPSLAPTVSERECRKIVESFVPIRRRTIVKGDRASNGEFPHMVAIGFEKLHTPGEYDFLCGGSLLSPTFVITSGLCGENLKGAKSPMVRVGVTDISDRKWTPSTDFTVAEVIVHPNFTIIDSNPFRTRTHHDISLIRLYNSVQFDDSIHPLCLNSENEDPEIQLTATSWEYAGKDFYTTANLFLMKVVLPVLDHTNCQQAFLNEAGESYLTQNHICIRYGDGKRGLCTGDSGGPLQGLTSKLDGHYRLIGVKSHERICGADIVSARVSRYRYWIEDIVWPAQETAELAHRFTIRR